ncbi:MAG: DUF5320 domain-containing protein [Halobacteriota archaeon]|nr:DUF5320 domain-containing protein [Halobacteriota archaeon]
MGNRHRNMYYATGQPGWMRFGYSPGWGELPPGAKYLSQTGQMPQFTSWMQNQSSTGRPVTPVTQDIPVGSTKEQEIRALENQADLLSKQLEEIKKRLKEIGE